MTQDIYKQLGDRLNKNPTKLPLTDAVLGFLQSIFTEDQATLGAAMPLGAHGLDDLARELGRDRDSLEAALEKMADQGLIFVEKLDAGERKYSLPPFFPGLVEFQLMKGGETDKDRAKARMLVDMMQGVEDMARGLFEDPETANKIIRPGLRTLTVETQLPLEMGVQSYERLAAVLEKETSFAAAVCHCRHQAKLVDNPCKVEGAPEKSCLYFGKAAEFMIDRGFAGRISKEECLDTLKACEDAGLVHNVNNFQGDNIVLCNCCGCCCDFMVKMKKFRGLVMVERSNFAAVVDQDSCVGCGECLKRCQLDAITLEGDAAFITADYCAGCGNCVAACPQACITMVRRADKAPREKPDFIVGLGV